MENTTDSPSRQAALELLAALVSEAHSWACEEDEGVIEQLEEAQDSEILSVLSESTLVPSELLTAVTRAVLVLAPDLAG